jgi:hypothetical protein
MEERIIAADPVTQPDEYKRELLALLGGDDPVEVVAETPAIFRRLTEGLDIETLQRAPEPGEWSVEELLAHFFNAEIVAGFRWRLVLAQDDPTLTPFDQDAWITLAHPDFHEMLDAFEALRRANVTLAKRTDESQWDRPGRHEERGPESFRDGLHLIAGHDRAHIKQLEQTIAAVTRQEHPPAHS